ncbi:MAG: hypothetical protein P8Y70_10195, partial [Candidatus Lokiarchaeota archaeon]
IFKLPFNTPIKKFDSNNKIHLKLVNFGKKGEIQSKKILNKMFEKREKITKYKLQRVLFKKLRPLLTEIDKMVIKDLS